MAGGFWRRTRMCLDLTLDERRFIAGVLLIFVIGLAARFMYVRSEQSNSYKPVDLPRQEQMDKP